MPQAVFCKKINFRKVIDMKIKSISKHVLAIVLSLAVLASAMMLNTFSVFAGVTPAEPDIWDGTLATIPEDATHPYDGGKGTAADPYLISTPEQFAYMLITANWGTTNSIAYGAHYKLLNDIYLNDVSAKDWYNSGTVTPWRGIADNDDECENRMFYGHIHGNGKTVYGLYITGSYYYGGLIYRFGNGASVEDLRISKAYVKNTSWSGHHGLLVATSWGGTTIKNCVVDDTTTLTASNTAGILIGGIQNDISSAVTIENCSVTGSVSADNNKSAFLGAASNNTKIDYTTTSHLVIKNSYYVGANQLVAENSNGLQPVKFENCYTTGEKVSNVRNDATGVTKRTLAEMTGAKARVYMNAFDFNNVWYTEAGKTPQLRALVETVPTEDTKLWKLWDGTVPSKPEGVAAENLWDQANVPFDGGAGTQADPYEISTPEQLAYLCTYANWYTGGKYFELTDDIYLNDVSVENWTENNPNVWAYPSPEPLFYGKFNGNGHTVYGLYMNSDLYYTGMFWRFGNGASVENLRISKSYVKTTKWDGQHGVLIGTTWGNTTVRNCVIDDTVELTAPNFAAPLIGGMQSGQTANVTVADCYVGAKISKIGGDSHFYAFLGRSATTNAYPLVVNNSYYVGDFDLAFPVTGQAPTFTNCYTTKVYDAEKEETAPTGVTASSNLEAMKTAGLTAVLNKFPKLGNVNADANAAVDVCDLVILKKFELGMGVDINIYATDVNNDREINEVDYLALQKYILNDASVFQ